MPPKEWNVLRTVTPWIYKIVQSTRWKGPWSGQRETEPEKACCQASRTFLMATPSRSVTAPHCGPYWPGLPGDLPSSLWRDSSMAPGKVTGSVLEVSGSRSVARTPSRLTDLHKEKVKTICLPGMLGRLHARVSANCPPQSTVYRSAFSWS